MMSELKTKLLKGEKLGGIMIRLLRNPAVAQLIKNSGLDYFMYDCEHAMLDIETLHDTFLLANALGIGAFVRVPAGNKEWISRVLDAGANGIMVPMVENRKQAEILVKYSKYQPIGGRGYSGGIAYSGYIAGKHTDVMAEQNSRVIAIAQIETKDGVANAEEIASVEGIDALLIGPNDLSIALGIAGDLMNPIELEAISKVAAACKKCHKAFGLHAGPALLEKFKDDINLAMCSTDTDVLTNGFKGIGQTIRSM
ncbi:MAG: HpcH/HpaI aldolase/citrate lyase family protein [Oscillospiraceae bacterium]